MVEKREHQVTIKVDTAKGGESKMTFYFDDPDSASEFSKKFEGDDAVPWSQIEDHFGGRRSAFEALESYDPRTPLSEFGPNR